MSKTLHKNNSRAVISCNEIELYVYGSQHFRNLTEPKNTYKGFKRFPKKVSGDWYETILKTKKTKTFYDSKGILSSNRKRPVKHARILARSIVRQHTELNLH